MSSFDTALSKVKSVWILAISSEGILLEVYRSRQEAEEAATRYNDGVEIAIACVDIPEGSFEKLRR